MREQKGITLIALVITIIVLLILAGVSIAMLTGQNGILTQATNAKTETAQAEAEEKINLALNAVKSKIYEKQVSNSSYNGGTSTLDTDIVSTVLTQDGFSATAAPANNKEGYWHEFANGTLTLHYTNPEAKITSITGSIDVDTAPYQITEAPIQTPGA